MSLTPESFPQMRAAARGARSLQTLDDAINLLAASVAAGSIRNVDFNEVKQILGRGLSDGWGRIKDAGVYVEMATNKPLETLFWELNVSNLHELTAARKKLAATSASGPSVDAMRSFVNECFPLTEALASLKPHIVMGRAPRPEPVPTNPDKLELTCPCCDNKQAVRGGDPQGLMVHHGYQRPFIGVQTASCDGTRFRALEISPDGLAHRVEAERQLRAFAQRALENKDSKASLPIMERERNGHRKIVHITPTDPRWRSTFDSWVWDQERTIRWVDKELPKLEQRLRDWKPVPVVAPRERRRQAELSQDASAESSQAAGGAGDIEADEEAVTESQGPRA